MKNTKRFLCILMSILMIALVVTGCGTEKVENKVTTITVDGKEKKGSYTGEFKTGKPHGNGVFKTQNKNGSRYTLTSHFKNGKPDGEAILRFESGSRNENVYKEGLLNGKCKSYFSNGKLGMEGEYKNGKQEGTFKQYYKSGKIAKECEYKNGKSTYEKLYYESGKLAFEGDPNGQGTAYYEDGSIYHKGKFVDGKPAK